MDNYYSYSHNLEILLVPVLVGIFFNYLLGYLDSNLSVEPTQRLTGNTGFAIGHQQMVAVWLCTDKVSPYLGDIKVLMILERCLNGLSIFHDDIIATVYINANILWFYIIPLVRHLIR